MPRKYAYLTLLHNHTHFPLPSLTTLPPLILLSFFAGDPKTTERHENFVQLFVRNRIGIHDFRNVQTYQRANRV